MLHNHWLVDMYEVNINLLKQSNCHLKLSHKFHVFIIFLFNQKKKKIETHFALSVNVSAINESLILFLAQHSTLKLQIPILV